MKNIKQSATSVIQIQIETGLADVSDLRFGFFQQGRTVVEYTLSDDAVEYEDGVARITLAPDVSSRFSPGRYRIEILAEPDEGTVAPVCGVLIGRVLPSDFGKECDAGA